MPINFSRKFWPNFSRGEKDRALSAAMTMPSMVFSLGPCMRTVNSEVVGSAPAYMGERWKTTTTEKQAFWKGCGQQGVLERASTRTRFLPFHFLIVPKYIKHNIYILIFKLLVQ